jgi:hypothetical protein
MADPVETPPVTPPASPPVPSGPPAPAPGAPPAAKVVNTGPRSEREISLEAELETERGSHAKTAKEKKDRETRIAELEDELHRLKQPPARPQPDRKTDLEEFFDW